MKKTTKATATATAKTAKKESAKTAKAVTKKAVEKADAFIKLARASRLTYRKDENSEVRHATVIACSEDKKSYLLSDKSVLSNVVVLRNVITDNVNNSDVCYLQKKIADALQLSEYDTLTNVFNEFSLLTKYYLVTKNNSCVLNHSNNIEIILSEADYKAVKEKMRVYNYMSFNATKGKAEIKRDNKYSAHCELIDGIYRAIALHNLAELNQFKALTKTK